MTNIELTLKIDSKQSIKYAVNDHAQINHGSQKGFLYPHLGTNILVF